MTDSPLLAGFLDYLTTERRLSAHTASNYRRDVATLLRLADATPLYELDSRHIRRFIAQLHAGGLGGKSLARALSAWRAFYRYLGRDHGYQRNPCVGLRSPKSARTLPAALSPEEAARLVEFDPENELEVRDRAMFELFYSSGLRLAELIGLDLLHLQLDQQEVSVTGKGAKTRIVPVGAHAIAALRAWLPLRASLAAADQSALFVNRRGGRLGPRSVQRRLAACARRQGLNSAVHPHLLRHSFASHVLQSSGDLRAVQELLGHASISTTQVYTHLDFQHLAKVYDAAHPRARKKS